MTKSDKNPSPPGAHTIVKRDRQMQFFKVCYTLCISGVFSSTRVISNQEGPHYLEMLMPVPCQFSSADVLFLLFSEKIISTLFLI